MAPPEGEYVSERKKITIIIEDDVEKTYVTFDSAEVKRFEQIEVDDDEISILPSVHLLMPNSQSMRVLLLLDAVAKEDALPMLMIHKETK